LNRSSFDKYEKIARAVVFGCSGRSPKIGNVGSWRRKESSNSQYTGRTIHRLRVVRTQSTPLTFAPGRSFRFFLLECGSKTCLTAGVRGVTVFGVPPCCFFGSTFVGGSIFVASGRRPLRGIVCLLPRTYPGVTGGIPIGEYLIGGGGGGGPLPIIGPM
jgi:hypothetical protein